MKPVEIPPVLRKRFSYICREKDGEINSFTIFANILFENKDEDGEDQVCIERYQDYGYLDIHPMILSRKSFDEYYEKIDELKQLSHSCIYCRWFYQNDTEDGCEGCDTGYKCSAWRGKDES